MFWSDCNGANSVPMIHVGDLATILMACGAARALDFAFVPATDSAMYRQDVKRTCMDIFSSIANDVMASVRCSSAEEYTDAVIAAHKGVLTWQLDLQFHFSCLDQIQSSLRSALASSPASSSSWYGDRMLITTSLADAFGRVWSEYLTFTHRTPCAIIVAGLPRSLKTKLANALANT